MDSEPGKLEEFSACAVSDALIKLGVPNGGYIPDITMFSPSGESHSAVRICGPAYTVQMIHAKESGPSPPVHFVDALPAGSIVVIAAPPEIKSAVWGGLMTAAAQFRGALGAVIDGRCRDLSEHRVAKFPVFARGHSTLGQATFTRPSELNVPITIRPRSEISSEGQEPSFSPVRVRPGDLILADEDGVVCVPVDMIQTVVELCTRAKEIDARCMEDIKNGRGVQETFEKWRGK